MKNTKTTAVPPVCSTCNDTHQMVLHGEMGHDERVVMCTRCPTPCEECRTRGPGRAGGPYCATTRCACQCHAKNVPSPAMVAFRASIRAGIEEANARNAKLVPVTWSGPVIVPRGIVGAAARRDGLKDLNGVPAELAASRAGKWKAVAKAERRMRLFYEQLFDESTAGVEIPMPEPGPSAPSVALDLAAPAAAAPYTYADERRWAGYRKEFASVTDEQLRCLRLVSQWLRGLHHAPDTVRPCTVDGIELVFHRGQSFASFDFDELTRLVFLAHDLCVRASIGSRGMHPLVMLHARDTRVGDSMTRHPTLEQVTAAWAERSRAVFP